MVPEYQGRGIGTDVLHRLASGRPERTALLSTPDTDSPARRLYRTSGFADLLTGFLFPGGDPPYAVMGAELPLRAPGSRSAQAEPLIDLPGRPRPVQRVEVQPGHALGE